MKAAGLAGAVAVLLLATVILAFRAHVLARGRIAGEAAVAAAPTTTTTEPPKAEEEAPLEEEEEEEEEASPIKSPTENQKQDQDANPPETPRSGPARAFIGMYPCSIGTPCPSYAAAFLASRRQLLSHPVTERQMARANTNMETASYHTMGGRGKYDVWRTVDAFDFAVEHLSMYERMLHAQRISFKESPLGAAVYETFLERLRTYEAFWRTRRRCDKAASGRSARTIGVMPFYAAGAGSGHTRRESKALYLNITIRSIKCHFGAVAVSCLHPGDKAYLEAGRGLPEIDEIVWIDPDRDLTINKPSFLGLATVRAVQQRWANATTAWSRNFDYVFYTEADQVLHVRREHKEKLFRPFFSSHDDDDNNAPSFVRRQGLGGRRHQSQQKRPKKKLAVVTPHRLNALPRSDDYAELFEAFDPAEGDEMKAAEHRRDKFHVVDASYDPRRDAWHANLFPTRPDRGGWVRRELDGYGAKNVLRVDNELQSGSCCYLRRGEREYPYNERGKAAGVRLDHSFAGDFGEVEDRTSPVDLLAFGDHGFGVLAGLCCHICARKGKLGRHCDNFCTPAAPGAEDCAVGTFADDDALHFLPTTTTTTTTTSSSSSSVTPSSGIGTR